LTYASFLKKVCIFLPKDLVISKKSSNFAPKFVILPEKGVKWSKEQHKKQKIITIIVRILIY